MEDKQFTYLIEAYKVAVDYFSGYADRVSNRFNILLTIDIALAGLFGSAWLINAQSVSIQGSLLLGFMGLLISILLYIQSAQDKYVLTHQIKRINDLRKKIEEYIKCDDIPALFSPLDDTDLGKRNFIFEDITSWRSNFISLTRIPPVTSLVFILFWVIVLFVRP